jgi:hypothetical protein
MQVRILPPVPKFMPLEDITNLFKGLDYQSEANSAWTLQTLGRKGEITHRTLQLLLNRTLDKDKLRETDIDVFFEHLINTQPQSFEYENFYELVAQNFLMPRVFKFPSETEGFNLDVCVIGFDYSGNVTALITHAVET